MARTFKLQIMSLKGLIFEEQVESLYLTGDDGEFELLPFHHPLLTSLPEGELKIAKFDPIPIKAGVLVFTPANECLLIVEADHTKVPMKQSWGLG